MDYYGSTGGRDRKEDEPKILETDYTCGGRVIVPSFGPFENEPSPYKDDFTRQSLDHLLECYRDYNCTWMPTTGLSGYAPKTFLDGTKEWNWRDNQPNYICTADPEIILPPYLGLVIVSASWYDCLGSVGE